MNTTLTIAGKPSSIKYTKSINNTYPTRKKNLQGRSLRINKKKHDNYQIIIQGTTKITL